MPNDKDIAAVTVETTTPNQKYLKSNKMYKLVNQKVIHLFCAIIPQKLILKKTEVIYIILHK